MKKRIILGLVVLGLATGLLFQANAGTSVPKGAEKEMMAGTIPLEATGCGIVKADEQKTTFKIKCEKCGFEASEIVIDTPTADKPYTIEWTCPKCGHKQTIVIQVKKE
jgi:DNA-directed RNA polymerase subunit M/transcription elongation factor TFIIS